MVKLFRGEFMDKNFTVRACHLFILGAFISFLGWIFEIIGRYIIYEVLEDRGFLFLPMCPIYGVTLVLCFLLLGTPKKTKNIISKHIKNKYVQHVIYFIFVTIFASITELITALALRPFDVILWTYEDQFLNFLGIICPLYSILWGVLITVFMSFLWDKLYNTIKKLPYKASVTLSFIWGTAISFDFIIQCAKLIQ